VGERGGGKNKVIFGYGVARGVGQFNVNGGGGRGQRMARSSVFLSRSIFLLWKNLNESIPFGHNHHYILL